ncbi:prephenate dehydrogenase [Sporomusa ovata DSM 2662]|uniref:Prephenate dehydrogenase n=1 Tax=Sporomusa ovata TaxID=2378 RepID=A0A0U1L3E3_9FIRM|nr:prephenate dehydrogenase/arogenate dehydrogenase family protein [Sporomusa ovata]EQB25671.1 prephenate dehydrogenase [Sporomusa ovata DSM 2662]CQR74227.1 Prephenate and/or arogenate dehydrogenase \
MMPAIKQIAIIGMGLIGGSLGLAIKASQGEKVEVTGIDTNELSMLKAKQCGAADRITADYKTGIKSADMIFVCTPVLQIATLIKEIAPHLKPGAILTDTGSTKTYLIQEITAVLPPGVHYVPGHPMAGREKSGIEAAVDTLFYDKWYILTPARDGDAAAVEAVRQVISWIGARVTEMNAAEHDWCTALISHVPHIGAAALVNLLMYLQDQENSIKLAGGGFRDTTRIASSNADMWADICMTNAEPIADSLDKFSQIVSQVAAAVRQGDRESIHKFFSSAKQRRDELLLLEQAASEQPLTNEHL